MSPIKYALQQLMQRNDVNSMTGLPDGTFTNAHDLGGLMSLIGARKGNPGAMGQNPQLPPQLQRQPVAYPQPMGQGALSQLAYRMANGAQQRIPTQPINPVAMQSVPMVNPTDILMKRFS